MNSSLHTTKHTTNHWQAVGAWQGGTVAAVALENGSSARGLLASGAGSYCWTQPRPVVQPLVEGLSDLNVVAVSFAGGSASTPSTALAATATGRLFRITPGTEAWQEISSWAGLGVAVVLAPSPTYDEDQTLFVGTPAGIFRTLDGGQHWESSNFGLLDEEVLCMVCSPDFAESELLWAGTAGGGLYRSRNSARAWRESGLGLPDAAVQSLAASPNFSTDRTVFAGMEAHGIYCSRDGGETWEPLALAGQSVNSLACAQADLLWAGTEDGLWRIYPGTGEAIQVTAAGEVVMSVAATADGGVAAGLFGSGLLLAEDGRGDPNAISWQRPEVVLHAPPVITRVGADLIALDSDGLMARSSDNGAAWQAIESASAEGVFAVAGAALDASNTAFFAATGTGLSRWDGEAAAWQEVAREPFQQHAALGVEVSPAFAADQTLLVSAHESELLLSQDAGQNWRTITGPWRGQSLLASHFAPGRANELVALTVQPNEMGHFAVSLWHTTDLGSQWEGIAGLTSGVPAVLMTWPQDEVEGAIFLATQHRVIKLYRAGDAETRSVHQHFFDESIRVTALAHAPDYEASRTVWAATSAGLYRSADGGINWERMLDLPLGLPVVWLDLHSTQVDVVTLGGCAWRAHLP